MSGLPKRPASLCEPPSPRLMMCRALTLYDEALALASNALEAEARAVMEAHPRIRAWCCGMGSYSFHDCREPISADWGNTPPAILAAIKTFNEGPGSDFNSMFGPRVPTVKLYKDRRGKIRRKTDW